MSDWALFWGIAALLGAAYALLGGFLEWIWGINPSRKTVGKMQGRSDITFWMVMHVIGCAVCGAAAGAQMVSQLGKTGALAALVFGCAVLYPVLGFSVLFVSVRHDGEGLAGIANWLYGTAGKSIAQVFIVLASAALVGMLSNGMLQLGLLQTLALSEMIAPKIKNEAHIRIAAFSGMAAGGMAACFVLLNIVDPMQAWPLVALACMICVAWSICVMMGAGIHALLDLLRRNSMRKKESVVQKLIAAGCMLALCLAITYSSWKFDFPLVAVLGTPVCLYAVFLCMAWMKYIGRGPFSRN